MCCVQAHRRQMSAGNITAALSMDMKGLTSSGAEMAGKLASPEELFDGLREHSSATLGYESALSSGPVGGEWPMAATWHWECVNLLLQIMVRPSVPFVRQQHLLCNVSLWPAHLTECRQIYRLRGDMQEPGHQIGLLSGM